MTCAHFLEVFRSSYQIMGYMVLSLLLGARVASARVDTADLTRPELPAGWSIENITLSDRYKDLSLKLDKNGSAIQTAAYPAAVTNLKITIKGNSIKGAFSLDIFSSADGTTFEANAWTNITGITGSKTDYVFILPAEPASRAFRFVYNKDKGNLGFYQVVAEYSDAAAPVAPNVLPAENVGATTFTANWEKVPGATDYLFTLERIVSAGMVVSNHFDNHPDYIEPGWEIPSQKFANTDASSGVAPNALKLEESGMIFQTPLYSSPITFFSFWAKTTTKKDHQITVSVLTNGVWTTLDPVFPDTTQGVYPFSFPPEMRCRRIKLDFIRAESSGSLMVDDAYLVLEDGCETVLDAVSVGDTNQYVAAELAAGNYRYAVRAKNEWGTSAPSNWENVEVGGRPPIIDPIPNQKVRVGEALSVPVALTQTDQDPIFATNVVAEGVSGASVLTNGVFTYTAAEEDVGEKTFTVKASDRDGETSVSFVVEICRRPLVAIPITLESGSYAQDFNTLKAEQYNTWDQGADPLPGWYAWDGNDPLTTYSGKGGASGIWSFDGGAEGGRQLGFRGKKDSTFRFGFSLTNQTEAALTSFDIAFDAVQKYVGSNQYAFVFSYRVGENTNSLIHGAWRRVPKLCLTAPFSTGDKTHYDTNFVQRLTARLPVGLLPGQTISFRWSDFRSAGAEERLAVDNLTVSWGTEGSARQSVQVGADGGEVSFDELESGDAALLPVGWRVADGSMNWEQGQDTVGNTLRAECVSGWLDQALIPAVGESANGVALIGRFQNLSKVSTAKWNVSYDLQKLQNGQKQTTVELYCSPDGINWELCPGAQAVFGGDPDEAACTPVESNVQAKGARFPRRIAEGAEFYLAWKFSGSGGGAGRYPEIGLNQITIAPEVAKGTVLFIQ